MLHELVVRNLGVIEHAEIVLGPGLTALTGETGAGKTLITEAISLLMGGRADPALVRTGADEAVVEGRFVDSDGEEITVRRVIPANGRSRAYLNGSMATATGVAEAAGERVEIHGQHGQQALLRSEARRRALDEYGAHDTLTLQQIRADIRVLVHELESLGGDEFERAREIELLEFQVSEIAAVGIVDAGEDERLAAQELLLGDATAHGEAAERAIELLSADGKVGSAVAEALLALRDRAPFAAESERLYAVQAELVDVVDSLRSVDEALADDPESLAELQRRREQLTGLRRKYGPDLAAVLAFCSTAQDKLETLQNHAERAAAVAAELADLRDAEAAAAAELAAARRSTAPKLSKAIVKELRRLALPKADLELQIGEVDPGDDVELCVAMNPGAPMLPLAKAASGGELSRVMLALQLVVGSTAATVIYDEVDAGVGGEAATEIGKALAGVGKKHQVLVVTHLPQVAACADRQVNIVKTIKGSTTRTELIELDDDGRVVELARMLSGSPDSDNARAHAAELLGSQGS